MFAIFIFWMSFLIIVRRNFHIYDCFIVYYNQHYVLLLRWPYVHYEHWPFLRFSRRSATNHTIGRHCVHQDVITIFISRFVPRVPTISALLNLLVFLQVGLYRCVLLSLLLPSSPTSCFSQTGPIVLRGIFLSKTSTVSTSFVISNHICEACIRTGRINFWWISIFVARYRIHD